ncbi:MAG: hypothetical protein WBW48_21610 [Anaerolineae bacterium]
MEEITFRIITPIFCFRLEHDDSAFLHSGKFSDGRSCAYNISLRQYERDEAALDELLKYADEDTSASLRRSIRSYGGFVTTDYFLVVDATYPFTEDLKRVGGSHESRHIHETILDSLRLHSCYAYHLSYHFRSHPLARTGRRKCGRSSPIDRHYILSYIVDEPPVLPDSEFDSCRSVFDVLLNKQWNDNVALDKLLRLALRYHKLTFNLHSAEHRFLLLMIVCDALFKKESERNASQAARRISRLLSTTQSDQKRIQREFFGNAPNTFYRLRNAVAHGDPDLDREVVRSKYWTLYHYVTRAIRKLVLIPDGEIDHRKNYYDEVSRQIDARFQRLPVS